jgi:putative transposase
MKPPPDPRYRHRFPAEIITHAVWLYHVFSLSLRDVELLLAERGIVVSYETVRRWCKKFGESFAKRLRRRRPRPGDKWYLDEVFIRIQGVQHYLWWIRTASRSISSFSHAAMPKPPSAFSGGC